MARAEKRPDPIRDAEAWRAARLAKTKAGRCWVCSSRQVAIVNELHRAGWGMKDLSTYLVEVHKHNAKDVTRDRLYRHFNAAHHEKAK